MKPVPREYAKIIETSCSRLSEGAKKIMWVAEMLGNDKFIVDISPKIRVEVYLRSKHPDRKL